MVASGCLVLRELAVVDNVGSVTNAGRSSQICFSAPHPGLLSVQFAMCGIKCCYICFGER